MVAVAAIIGIVVVFKLWLDNEKKNNKDWEL